MSVATRVMKLFAALSLAAVTWGAAGCQSRNDKAVPFPLSRPSSEGIGSLYISASRTESIWLRDPDECAALLREAFAMDPIADDGWAWSEFGADTFIVLDRTGDLIGEIAYYDEPPNVRARRHTSARGGNLERDRLAGTQFQGGSFVQVIGEQRLFPVDSRWQGAMSSALSRHRHLHSMPLTVSPGAQMEWVLGKARQVGLSPEGAIWGWHGPSVSLCGKAAVRSRGRPEIEAAEVQRRADAVLAEQVNAVRRELSVRVTRPTRYRLTRERQTTRVEAWREMVFPNELDADRIRSGLARAGVSEYVGPEIRDSNTIDLLFASPPSAERIDRLRKLLQTKASAGAAG